MQDHQKSESPTLQSVPLKTTQQSFSPAAAGDGKSRSNVSCFTDSSIFGRDKEIQALRDAVFCPKTGPQLVLVSGHSGTGKTMVVLEALQRKHSHHYNFVLGKFDQQQFPEPYGPIVSALGELALRLDQNLEEQANQLSLSAQLDWEVCQALRDLAPELGRLFRSPTQPKAKTQQPSHQKNPAYKDQLQLALTKFFEALYKSYSQSVCLVLDDLQWADSESLNLLESLIAKTPSLSVVGICRSNQVPWEHGFAQMLRRLEDELSTSILHIQVENLSLQDTQTLVAKLLFQHDKSRNMDEAQRLAQRIYERTQGNAFFTTQLVKALCEEGTLNASIDWEDDSPLFQHDVLELVQREVQRQDPDTQRFLMKCACLGAEVDREVLGDCQIHVKSAIKSKLLVQRGTRRVAFAHDRIQQAAYSMIPSEERALSHLTLGQDMINRFDAEAMETYLFLVVNQLCLGADLITDSDDKSRLAELCCRAGTRALKMSNVLTAIHFLQSGIDLLPTRNWRDEYHLSLLLYGSRAEAECTGTFFEQVENTVQEIVANCRNDGDKVSPYITLVYSLQMQERMDEALNIGLNVLDAHGIILPRKPKLINIIWESIKLERRLAQFADEDFLNLPQCEDSDVVTLMSMLQVLEYSAFVSNPEVFPLLVFKLLKLTLKHGLSDLAPLAFASHGVGQIQIGNYAAAERYARLGEAMHERTGGRDDSILLPRLQFLVNSFVYAWTRPIEKPLKMLDPISRTGFQVGDIEMFGSAKRLQFCNAYFAGERLPTLREDLRNYFEMLVTFMQHPKDYFSELHAHVVANLMGEQGSDVAADILGNKALNMDIRLLKYCWLSWQIQNRYLLGDMEACLSHLKALRPLESVNNTLTVTIIQCLFEGMVSMEAARRRKKLQHILRAKKMIKKFKYWSKVCPQNFDDKLFLLLGEMEMLKKNLESGVGLFAKAIDQAKSNGVRYVEALANERAGAALLQMGCRPVDSDNAKKHIKRAIDVYGDWGAHAVVAKLKERYGCFLKS